MEITRCGFILVVIFASSFLLFLLSYSDNTFSTFSITPWMRLGQLYNRRGYLIDTIGCQIPDLDPFDSSVIRFYYNNSQPYVCSRKPSFLFVGTNARILLDKGILRRYYDVTSEKNIVCSYQAIRRDSNNTSPDDKVLYIAEKLLQFNSSLGEDYIRVKCLHKGNVLHDEFFALTPLKESVESRCANASASSPPLREQLNVIFIGIDSISKLNFIRHFPKARLYLLEVLKAVEFHGYNKVGDNTFPNLVPLLTGQFIDYYWNESKNDYYFDDIDLIWKDFAKRGYRTLMAEDAPEIATFNYMKNGFINPPTDYYLRPFSLAVEQSSVRKRSKVECFDSRMELKVIYDYATDFALTMKDRPHFAFVFGARLTHDYLNNAGLADMPVYQTLKMLHENNVTNNSVLVFFSDHGIRFGNIRETFIGKYEERLPIMFLVFPPWFLQKYPRVAKNLRTNERRLVTPFDIHRTLQHLLDFSGLPTGRVNVSNRGISVFEEIPGTRTCANAAILPHWCTCQSLSSVDTNRTEVVKAAVSLIAAINDLLSAFSDVCAKLVLDTVTDARMGTPRDEVLRFQQDVNDVVGHYVEYGARVDAPVDFLLTVRAAPSDAMFEGTVRYDKTKHTFTVLRDVSRINRYGNQSICIKDARLKKYCYCKKQQVDYSK